MDMTTYLTAGVALGAVALFVYLYRRGRREIDETKRRASGGGKRRDGER